MRVLKSPAVFSSPDSEYKSVSLVESCLSVDRLRLHNESELRNCMINSAIGYEPTSYLTKNKYKYSIFELMPSINILVLCYTVTIQITYYARTNNSRKNQAVA